MGNICDADGERQKTSAREILKASSNNKLVCKRESSGNTPDVREVRGPITLKNGSIYEGEWLNGMRDGYGVHQWLDGACYKG